MILWMDDVFFRMSFTRIASICLEKIVECCPPSKRMVSFFDFDFKDSEQGKEIKGTEMGRSGNNENQALVLPMYLKRKVDDRIRE